MDIDQYIKLMTIWCDDNQAKHSDEDLKNAFQVFDKVKRLMIIQQALLFCIK